MYDRRVVRGNTFAALVIPVSKLNHQNLIRVSLYIWSLYRYVARSCIDWEIETWIKYEKIAHWAVEGMFNLWNLPNFLFKIIFKIRFT